MPDDRDSGPPSNPPPPLAGPQCRDCLLLDYSRPCPDACDYCSRERLLKSEQRTEKQCATLGCVLPREKRSDPACLLCRACAALVGVALHRGSPPSKLGRGFFFLSPDFPLQPWVELTLLAPGSPRISVSTAGPRNPPADPLENAAHGQKRPIAPNPPPAKRGKFNLLQIRLPSRCAIFQCQQF